MRDFFRWLARSIGIGVLWVFLLSIRIQGETIFSHANEILVQNKLVAEIDEGLGELWFKISETASRTFKELGNKSEDEA